MTLLGNWHIFWQNILFCFHQNFFHLRSHLRDSKRGGPKHIVDTICVEHERWVGDVKLSCSLKINSSFFHTLMFYKIVTFKAANHASEMSCYQWKWELYLWKWKLVPVKVKVPLEELPRSPQPLSHFATTWEDPSPGNGLPRGIFLKIFLFSQTI